MRDLLIIRRGGMRAEIWRAIRAMREDITVGALCRETGISRHTVGDYVRCLAAGGFLARSNPGAAVPRYALARDVGKDAPRLREDGSPLPATANERMWAAMKALSRFTYRDIAFTARVPAETAKDYLKNLRAAGYLAVLRESGPGIPTDHKLLPSRNTGRQPPQILRIQAVYDPNEGRIVHPPELVEGGS
jgi:hypothetical protein